MTASGPDRNRGRGGAPPEGAASAQIERTTRASTSSSEPDRIALAALPSSARLIVWPLLAIVLVHTLIIGLWVAPPTPLRDWIGQDRVREYVQPWFDQNWSIFAPNPRRVAVTFEVRASLADPAGGAGEVTEWADLIDNEDAIVLGNPFPPRTSKLTRRTTDRLHSAVGDMNDEQREQLKANYTDTPVEHLRDRLLDVEDGAGPGAVDNYLDADDAATRIATAFARTEWSERGEPVRVQYRTSTRPAPAWNSAADHTLDDTERNHRDYGWRAAAQVSDAERQHFESYLAQGGR